MKIFTTLCVLAQVVDAVIGISCSNNAHADGCSIPGNLPFFYKSTFTPACNQHDICYFCGKMYGVTRHQCDNQFEHEMMRTCNHLTKRFLLSYDDVHMATCKTTAVTYYEAVHIGAQNHFEAVSPSWCKESWVRSCLP